MISIHAAREGGDAGMQTMSRGRKLFQSTPPVKAATRCGKSIRLAHGISIHAAREGGDGSGTSSHANPAISIHAAREGGDSRIAKSLCVSRYFNPRRP